MSVFCVALFAFRLLISFKILSRSTWEKLKDKPALQFFFIATKLWWNLYFMIAFISGSPVLWCLTGSFSLYWGIRSVVMILEKNSFEADAVVLPFSKILSSSTKAIFSLQTTSFDSKGLTTHQYVLLSHKLSQLDSQKTLLLFRESVTHKFLYLT